MSSKNIETWQRPEDSTLQDWISTRVARFEDREYDFSALKFQADFDPKYRRAQMRYMGTGATGISGDNNTVQAENFTFSTMLLPAGCEGPPHVHTDAEEVFFMLRGSIELTVEDKGEETSLVLNYRDLISIPPNVYRGLRNHTQEDALMCVMIGNPKPVIPTYPEDHPLSKIKR